MSSLPFNHFAADAIAAGVPSGMTDEQYADMQRMPIHEYNERLNNMNEAEDLDWLHHEMHSDSPGGLGNAPFMQAMAAAHRPVAAAAAAAASHPPPAAAGVHIEVEMARVLSPASDMHACSCCLNLVYQAVGWDCAHIVCAACDKKMVRKFCPTCKVPGTTATPATSVRHIIALTEVKCAHADEGCTARYNLGGIGWKNEVAHKAACPFEPCVCLGCNTVLPRSRFDTHKKSECPKRLQVCDTCDELVPACEHAAHVTVGGSCLGMVDCPLECMPPKRQKSDPSASAAAAAPPRTVCKIKRVDLEQHQRAECPNRRVVCTLCDRPHRARNTEDHLNDPRMAPVHFAALARYNADLLAKPPAVVAPPAAAAAAEEAVVFGQSVFRHVFEVLPAQIENNSVHKSFTYSQPGNIWNTFQVDLSTSGCTSSNSAPGRLQIGLKCRPRGRDVCGIRGGGPEQWRMTASLLQLHRHGDSIADIDLDTDFNTARPRVRVLNDIVSTRTNDSIRGLDLPRDFFDAADAALLNTRGSFGIMVELLRR